MDEMLSNVVVYLNEHTLEEVATDTMYSIFLHACVSMCVAQLINHGVTLK